ncbi:hypothetical protein JR316_0012885 [Psilocybe cubensis]|uniref:Uncharacterized protein n=2 Tax=Psilocybe cubensis TaxID=181762 RepID=A0A8H7XTQ9_PSICU|nr:hypothetical protein JR316_0012885 [Psilocybe cubensis]KAH9474426.1 hypothetical protein JR316_0012885 [Psilocybe cubensis]
MKGTLQTLTALLFLARAALSSPPNLNNPIYIISNAEVPSLSRGGLSPVGQRRANNCLPKLFQNLDIGKIIMCPKNKGSDVCFETLPTTQPTADALGLPIDTSCGADEKTSDNCVQNLVKNFAKTSTQAILIVWDQGEVGTLLEDKLDLNTGPADAIDGVHFDVFTVVHKGVISQVTSQNCTGIDGIAAGTDANSPSAAALAKSKSKSKKKEKRALHRRW